MRKIALFALCSMALAWLMPVAGLAQEKGYIELRSMAEVEVEVVDDRGETVIERVPAVKAYPGDEVVFTTIYTNISAEKADNVTITNPVPEHMLLSKGTAKGRGTAVTFSVDGGQSFDIPENLKVKGEDNRERPARASEYTHIRWRLIETLGPEQRGEVSFRAVIE